MFLNICLYIRPIKKHVCKVLYCRVIALHSVVYKFVYRFHRYPWQQNDDVSNNSLLSIVYHLPNKPINTLALCTHEPEIIHAPRIALLTFK